MVKQNQDILRDRLSVLIGHRLTRVSRTLDLLVLSFGPEIEDMVPKLTKEQHPVFDENRNPVLVSAVRPQFTIDVSCFSRFTFGGKIVLAYNDRYQPSEALKRLPDFARESFDHNPVGGTRLDELIATKLTPIIENTDNFKVEKVTVSNNGDIELYFLNGFTFQIFVDAADARNSLYFFDRGNKTTLTSGGNEIALHDNAPEYTKGGKLDGKT